MENQIKMRRLGQSDLRLSPVGLGCWQFSKKGNLAGKFWPNLDDSLIHDIVRKSLKGGINWFDTAELYGNGESEKALAKALLNEGIDPGNVVIATKWWPLFRTASNMAMTIDRRLECLKPYPVDLYMVHQPFGFSSVKKEMEAMARLVHSKKIRYVGVSNYSATQMRRAWETLKKYDLQLISNQVRYNLLDRKIETNGIMDVAKELGVSVIAYSPLAQGLLTGKFHENPELVKSSGFRKYYPMFGRKGLEKSLPVIETLKRLAVKYQVTPAQIALNWLITFHGETVVAIPGASRLKQAEENIGAMTFVLEKSDVLLLDKVSRKD